LQTGLNFILYIHFPLHLTHVIALPC